MNREFKPSSRPARSVFAVIAFICTALVLGSIEGLARHYSGDAQLAKAASIVMAQSR